MQSIIIDTDIGYDIADTWALNFMLSTNLFDVKLISVTHGDIDYQVALVAKILKLLNKEYIPIVRGVGNLNNQYPQKRWLEDFDLKEYNGVIYDSLSLAYEEVLANNNDVIVTGIAPFTSLSTIIPILKKYNTKIVAMAGSFKYGYFDKKGIVVERNISSCVAAAKKILASDLNITLLPLDVCNKMIISGDIYQKIRSLLTDIASIVSENYDIWQEDYVGPIKKFDINLSSSVLLDLAPALYLLFPQNFEVMEKNIYVDDNGFTLIGGRHLINVAFNVHKLSLMLKFAGEQYCTNFSYSKDIKQLEIEGMYSLTYVLKKCNVLLSVIEYGWEVHKAGSSYGPAERDYYILHFITKGKGRFVIGDKEYILKKGDCFLLPPKITTYYEADKKNPYTYYWVGFDGIEAKGLLEKTGLVLDDNYVVHPKNFNSVFEMFSNFDVSTTNNSAIPYQLVGKLYLLFSEIMSDQSSENEQKSNYVDLAINYMNLNYAKNISIELLSRIVGVDRTYFYRLFKESTKISPKEYLSNLRIEKAKMLLCNSNMNIKEIALSVGFSNYLSFERVFKEKSGVNPTIYRKKNT